LGVSIQLGSTVTAINFGTPAIHIKGKPDFRADGLKSVCREALLGHADPPKLTGDLAYRIVVKAEDMVKHENLQELVSNPAINYWMGLNAHAVCYLLKGGGLYNIVLACPDNLPELVSTQATDIQEMRDLFAKWDPRLKTLLSIVQETSKWRLQNSEEMKKWSHPSGKFALLGDACHATLPYLAQGAAMVVEDGAVLGALMEKLGQSKGSTALREIFHLEDGERQQG
jgi:salicylate hydroxylase